MKNWKWEKDLYPNKKISRKDLIKELEEEIEALPDFALVELYDEISAIELDRRYEEIREELELYQEFSNS